MLNFNGAGVTHTISVRVTGGTGTDYNTSGIGDEGILTPTGWAVVGGGSALFVLFKFVL